MREGSIIFRFEWPTSRKSAKCNRKTRRFWCFQRSHINFPRAFCVAKHRWDSGLAEWNLDWPLDSWLDFEELICFCRVRLLFPWVICFCRDSLTHSENVHVNTRAKGNPVKAVREGSIIFRFEWPTSWKSATCNRKTRRFWCFQISQT